MFKSGRPPIALVIAKARPAGDDPNHQDPDNDAGDDVNDPGDIELADDDGEGAPAVYLPGVKGLPGFLREGYEGEVTFRVRVTERASHPDGGSSLGLELLEMEPPTETRGGGKPSDAMRAGDAMSRNFDAAFGD